MQQDSTEDCRQGSALTLYMPNPHLHFVIYYKYSVHLTRLTKYSCATPRQFSSGFSCFIVMDEVDVF